MTTQQVVIYSFSAINVGLFIFLTTLSLKGWKRSIRNRYYFGLLVSSIVWLVTANLLGLHPSNLILGKLDFFGASGVAFFFAVFSASYVKNNDARRIINVASTILFVILTLFSFISSAAHYVDSAQAPLEAKVLYGIYITLLAILSVGIGGITIFRQWRVATGIQRQQIGYFLFGFIPPIVIILLMSVYNSLIRHVSDDTYSLLSNIGIIFALTCTKAIFRYRFLDIRVVLRRSLVRAASFLALLLVYLLLILILRDTLVSETKELNPTSLIVVGLLIILTVEPLRKYIYNFVDKRFELHDRHQERIQKQLQIVLKSQRSLSDLEQAIRKAFQETASVEIVDYVDADDQKLISKPALRAYLQSTGKIVICEELPYRLDEDVRFKQVNDEVKGGTATAYVPIGQNEIFVGSFVLGPRKGKVAYSAQEVSAMKLLQSQATDAFLNARLYKQAVERIRV